MRWSVVAGAVAVLLAAPAVAGADCRGPHHAEQPRWAQRQQMTVLMDSVLLSGERALRRSLPCWRLDVRGRPALMVRQAERELRDRGRRVRPLVVIGLGYNSLFERDRRRYDHWAARWDREAEALIATLRDLGARRFVWVTLREPTRRTVPSGAEWELRRYAWFFPYVNERLDRLDGAHDRLALADWAAVSREPGLTYDSIHLNRRGGRLMGRTIRSAVYREARRERREPSSRGSRSTR